MLAARTGLSPVMVGRSEPLRLLLAPVAPELAAPAEREYGQEELLRAAVTGSGEDELIEILRHLVAENVMVVEAARGGAWSYLQQGSTAEALRLAETGLAEADRDLSLLSAASKAAWMKGHRPGRHARRPYRGHRPARPGGRGGGGRRLRLPAPPPGPLQYISTKTPRSTSPTSWPSSA